MSQSAGRVKLHENLTPLGPLGAAYMLPAGLGSKAAPIPQQVTIRGVGTGDIDEMSPLLRMGAGQGLNYLSKGTDFAGVGSPLVSAMAGNAAPLAGWGAVKAIDLMSGAADAASTASAIGTGAELGFGNLMADGATAGSVLDGAAGSALPYAGSIVKLIQGDVGGAAGTALGTYLGSITPLGPIGGMIGGAIGGILGGGCFITTAVLHATGDDSDSGPELRAMRQLRDEYILGELGDADLVRQYYQIAPRVVLALSRRDDADQVYEILYYQFIKPATELVQSGDMNAAYQTYLAMIEFAVPFAQEVDPSETKALEMEGLKRHALETRGGLALMNEMQ